MPRSCAGGVSQRAVAGACTAPARAESLRIRTASLRVRVSALWRCLADRVCRVGCGRRDTVIGAATDTQNLCHISPLMYNVHVVSVDTASVSTNKYKLVSIGYLYTD